MKSNIVVIWEGKLPISTSMSYETKNNHTLSDCIKQAEYIVRDYEMENGRIKNSPYAYIEHNNSSYYFPLQHPKSLKKQPRASSRIFSDEIIRKYDSMRISHYIRAKMIKKYYGRH